MFRFLHLADLHLSSPLAAFSREAAERWRGAQFAALEDLISRAVGAGVSFLLFSGDVFDTPRAPREDVARFYGILSRAGVPAVVAPGNHDFYTPDGTWHAAPPPENLCLFTERELGFFDFPELGATVYGFAFRSAAAKAPALGVAADRPTGRVSILLAHSDITAPLSPYAPLPTGALAASGFAYAALGHIHNPPLPARFGRTLAAYSGFFGGRGFDEPGAGHALLCTVREGEPTAIHTSNAPLREGGGARSAAGGAREAADFAPSAETHSFVAPNQSGSGTRVPAEESFAARQPLAHEGAVEVESIETAAPLFLAPALDCTGAADAAEVREKAAEFLAACHLPDLCAVRLRLCGEVGVDCTPRVGDILPLGDRFSLFDCVDETLPALSDAALAADVSLRGAFYRALLPHLQSGDAAVRRTAAKALRAGLAALDGKEAEL